MKALWLAVVMSVSCRDAEAPPPPPCEPTLAAARDRVVAEQRKTGDPGSSVALRTELMIASCEGDRWDPRVLRCIAAAPDERSVTKCLDQLTHEQYTRLTASIAPLEQQAPARPAVDAGVTDAMIVTDAAVDATPVDAARRDAAIVRPRPDAGAQKLDCSKRIIDARDRDCRDSYCKSHPADPKCELE